MSFKYPEAESEFSPSSTPGLCMSKIFSSGTSQVCQHLGLSRNEREEVVAIHSDSGWFQIHRQGNPRIEGLQQRLRPKIAEPTAFARVLGMGLGLPEEVT